MAGPFDSAWLKWARAVLHAETLERDIKRATANAERGDIALGVRHYDAKRHGFPVDVVYMRPYPVAWGLALGDIAGNYRSALDHVAWAVVGRGHNPNLSERQAQGVYFPIANTRDKFNSNFTRMLPGARRADIATIRRHQPYQAGKRRQPSHALSILATLCNDDKHRTIQPVHMLPSEAAYQVTERYDCAPTTDKRLPRRRVQPMEVGTEIGLIRVRKTGPNPKVKVESQLRLHPGIDRRITLAGWLTHTRDAIGAILSDFAEPPFELFAEMADPRIFFRSQ